VLEYRGHVARLCERPGCSSPADVAYGFDAEQLVVWLDGFHVAQGARSGVLCRRHADAMVVPLGWMLDDRREPIPRLFKTTAGAAPKPKARRPRSPRDATGEQLRLDPSVLALLGDQVAPAAAAASASVAVAVAVAEVADHSNTVDRAVEPLEVPADDPAEALADLEPVAPWQPQFDETDDLEGLLNARGRLLSRAFNGVSSSD
jgi:hypothetical protein